MASAANPLLGGGGGGPTLPPQLMGLVMGALSNRTASAGKDLSEEMSGAQGADPSMVLRQLEQVNQVLGVLFVKSFQQLPNVANQISATMKQLSRAIKEAQQASNVTETIAPANEPPPISFSAARMGENSAPSYTGGA